MTEDVTFEENLEEIVDSSEIAAEGKSVSPLRALRKHCLWCCGSSTEVKLCPARACPLWTFRLGHRPTTEDKAAVADLPIYPFERPTAGGEFHEKGGTALRAIRKRCVDCSGGSGVEANACNFSDCDLYSFRKGKNPNVRVSEERRAVLLAALAALRGRNGG